MHSVSLKPVLIFLFAVLGVYAFSIIFSWYDAIPWLDSPLHFFGGLWAGLFFFFLFGNMFSENSSHPMERVKILIMAVGFTGLLGIFWEFYEFIMDNSLALLMQPSIGDTMKDLFLDILGGAVAGVFILFLKPLWERKKEERV